MIHGVKKIFIILIVGLAILTTIFIYVNVSKYKEQEVVILDTENWATLVKKEPFGGKTVSVINHINSPGSVIIRINDAAGNPIIEKILLTGNSKQFDLPIIDGDDEITIRARAESNAGTYVLVVRED